MKDKYAKKLFSLEDVRWWSVARRRILEHVWKRLKLGTNIDILELGCGTGGNLQMLSQFGNVFAVDTDDAALQMAASRGIGDVEKGHLPHTIPFDSKQFDVIVLLDVLEHIDEESLTLKKISERLKANGKILVSVPAYDFLWSRIDIDSGHKRRYIKKRLNAIIQTAGFSIIYSTYFNTNLFPVISMIRIINKLRGKHDNLDLKMPSLFINSVLTNIFSLEKEIMPKLSMPFGVSILTIASKKD